MKRILQVFMFVVVVSCAEKPMNVDEAKRIVEELIVKADAEDFAAVEKLYAPEFNLSEPMEIKRKKLLKLKGVMGSVKSVEFLSFKHVAEFGQPKKIILQYKVTHSKITSNETFTVIEEEGGYKVSSHSIESAGNS